MTGPANMNYASLNSDVKSYLERYDDTRLNEQLPRLIMMAENRIATDAKILGYQKVVTGTLTQANPVQVKPAYWRTTVSFNFTDAGERKQLLLRTYEYCRNYWPDPTEVGEPRYFADYNFDNFFIAATPDIAYPFELVYMARQDPLSSANNTNWLTANAPQLLLFACLYEAEIWLKNVQTKAARKEDYESALAGFQSENGSRAVDRGIVLS